MPTGLDELRRSWGLILAFGICLVVVGAAALGALPLATEATMIFWGIALIASGLVYAIDAFLLRRWNGCVMALLLAILDVVVGFLMLTYTWQFAMAMTLMLAIYFVVSGLDRIIVPFFVKFPGRGLSILGGVISLLLGVAIWRRWPWNTFWVIGLFVGIEMLIRGFSLIALALAARQIPQGGTMPAGGVRTA
jgi:uncharacterized membrane protein HdeD (DUF308 family)